MASSVSRYVFTFHTKVKWASSAQNLFMITYLEDDQTALDMASYLEAHVLPNNMKCTVSKTLRIAPSAELPERANLTDEFLTKYLVETADQNRVNLTLPQKPGINVDSIFTNVISYVRDSLGNEATGIISYNVSGKNIVTGGEVPPSSREDHLIDPLP